MNKLRYSNKHFAVNILGLAAISSSIFCLVFIDFDEVRNADNGPPVLFLYVIFSLFILLGSALFFLKMNAVIQNRQLTRSWGFVVPFVKTIYPLADFKYSTVRQDRLYGAANPTSDGRTVWVHYIYFSDGNTSTPVTWFRKEKKAISEAKKIADLYGIRFLGEEIT